MEGKASIQHDKKHIALFFTYGVSLTLWKKKGMLSRELALYKSLAEKGYRFSFFTYADDTDFAEELLQSGITVYSKNCILPKILYSLLLPFIYRHVLVRVDVLKTNQMLGSWTGVIAKWLTKKPLIVRTGYTLSIFAKQHSILRYGIARVIERFATRFANILVVATDADKKYMSYCARESTIIPNYVDTTMFAAKADGPLQTGVHKLLYIGRLESQKNVTSLISALEHMEGTSLTIIGDGSQRKELALLAGQRLVPVDFVGAQAHERLPSFMQEADVFVLPSLYEGLPKVLLESMAAGLPIVTTDVPGIRGVVEHEKTALVVPPTAEGLRRGVCTLMDDANLAARIGKAAREHVLTHYSLEIVTQKEEQLYETHS